MANTSALFVQVSILVEVGDGDGMSFLEVAEARRRRHVGKAFPALVEEQHVVHETPDFG